MILPYRFPISLSENAKCGATTSWFADALHKRMRKTGVAQRFVNCLGITHASLKACQRMPMLFDHFSKWTAPCRPRPTKEAVTAISVRVTWVTLKTANQLESFRLRGVHALCTNHS